MKMNQIFSYIAILLLGSFLGFLFWCSIPIFNLYCYNISIENSTFNVNDTLFISIVISCVLIFPIVFLFRKFLKSKYCIKGIKIVLYLIFGLFLGISTWLTTPIYMHYINGSNINSAYYTQIIPCLLCIIVVWIAIFLHLKFKNHFL